MKQQTAAWRQTLLARWAALGGREQRALRLGALAIGAALVWGVALAPALRSLKAAYAQNVQLAAATVHMQAMQTRARALQAKPVVSPQESMAALRAAVAPLGKAAVMQVLGEQTTLTLKQIRAQDLAPLLVSDAGSLLSPIEVHLQREASTAEARWSGTLVFHLPAQKSGTP